MKTYFTYICIFFASIITVSAQIGENTITPDASAEFEIVSTSKGVLLPIMTNAQMLAIASPATGLIVYNATKAAYYYYNGSIWAMIGTVGKTLMDGDGDTFIQVEETADEDIVRVDIGNNSGAPFTDKVTISSATTTVQGDYTIPTGSTLKIGATPLTMPSTAGDKGTVLSTNGTGTWSWVEPHGGLGIANGVQTMYFAETDEVTAINTNTYYIPVIPFSSITVDSLEIYIGTINGSPSFRMAIFDAAGNRIASSNATAPVGAGLFNIPLTTSILLMSAELYYFAVTDLNNTTTTILKNGRASNPYNKFDTTSDLTAPTMGAPAAAGESVWIAAH